MKRKLLVPIFVTLSFTACSNMSDTQQRALSGGAIGAAAGTAGALIFNGNPIWGAIGGAAVGTAMRAGLAAAIVDPGLLEDRHGLLELVSKHSAA